MAGHFTGFALENKRGQQRGGDRTMSDIGVPMCPICAAAGGLGATTRETCTDGLIGCPTRCWRLPLRLAVATVFWNSGEDEACRLERDARVVH